PSRDRPRGTCLRWIASRHSDFARGDATGRRRVYRSAQRLLGPPTGRTGAGGGARHRAWRTTRRDRRPTVAGDADRADPRTAIAYRRTRRRRVGRAARRSGTPRRRAPRTLRIAFPI